MISRMRGAFLLPLLLSTLVLGQEAPKPSPEQELAAKLQQPFLQHAAWTTEWDVAKERAAKTNKLIFGYFTTAGY